MVVEKNNIGQSWWSIILAIFLHVVIFLLISGVFTDVFTEAQKTVKKLEIDADAEKIINATVFDEQQVDKLINAVKKARVTEKKLEEKREQDVLKKEKKRLQKIEDKKRAKAQALVRKKAAEKQRLVEQKQRLEEQQKKKVEAALALVAKEKVEKLALAEKKKAEAKLKKKQAEQLKRQKEAEKARLAKLEKALREAEARHQAQERQRIAEELERKQQEQARIRVAQQKAEADQRARVEQAKINAMNKHRATRLIDRAKRDITKKVTDNWIKSIDGNLRCKIKVHLKPGGIVTDARAIVSSGNTIFDRSAENAVRKASPLPVPSNPELFEYFKTFEFNFKPK